MKNIIILLVIFSLNAQAQSKRLIEVAREFTTKDIMLSDGLVYKWKIGATNDTARYFNAGGDEYEVVATFKKVGGADPDPVETVTIIDSTPNNPSNKYYGNWSHTSGSNWLSSFHDQTGSYNTGTADSLVIMVDGYKAEWYTEKRFNHGIAEVRIDNKFAAGIDLYSSRSDNNSQLVWTGLFLTDGQHKITIRYTGQKNDASTQATIIHDRLVVYKNQ